MAQLRQDADARSLGTRGAGDWCRVLPHPGAALLGTEIRRPEPHPQLDVQGHYLLARPISALTIAESQPLVRVAFAHTRMHEADMAATGIALAIFSIGM